MRSHPPRPGHPHAQPPPHQPPPGPRPKQLRALRRLAHAAGQTFTYPRTKAQASAEIHRLATLLNAAPLERLLEQRIERDRLHREVELPADATRVRADETTGYGANCRWAHTTDPEDRS